MLLSASMFIRSLYEAHEMNAQRANRVSIFASMSQYRSCSKDFHCTSFKLCYLLGELNFGLCLPFARYYYYDDGVKVN
jgi:hypothetical protein